jgi:hypothetical protein
MYEEPQRHLREPRFTRTSIKSQELHVGVASNVRKVVWHVYKPPPLGLYKEEAAAQLRALHHLYPCSRTHIHPILARHLNHLAGTWMLLLFSCLTCSPLYRDLRRNAIQRARATCWTYDPVAGTRINSCPCVA